MAPPDPQPALLDPSDQRSSYDALREQAMRDLHEGLVQEALAGFRAAARIARESGDPDRIAVALSNLTQAAIESGIAPPSATRLREALTWSREPLSRYLCARALAGIYLETHDLAKASFYARMAHQVAPRRHGAAAEQTLGIVLLARGDWQGALPHLRRALDDWPHEQVPVVLGLSTFAYLWSITGDRREATSAIALSIDRLHELDGTCLPSYREDAHLSLGFALLEMGDADRACHHAEEALRVATATDRPRRPHEHKMALYLAAEAALDAGRAEAGWNYVDELQRTYYPGWSDLRDLLVAVRTSGMVNWLA